MDNDGFNLPAHGTGSCNCLVGDDGEASLAIAPGRLLSLFFVSVGVSEWLVAIGILAIWRDEADKVLSSVACSQCHNVLGLALRVVWQVMWPAIDACFLVPSHQVSASVRYSLSLSVCWLVRRGEAQAKTSNWLLGCT